MLKRAAFLTLAGLMIFSTVAPAGAVWLGASRAALTDRGAPMTAFEPTASEAACVAGLWV